EFHLVFVKKAEVILQPLQRGNTGGKDFVKLRLDGLPKLVKRRGGQFRFGIKEIIKTPLANPGFRADGVDGDGAVALLPDQITGRLQHAFFGITSSPHKCSYQTYDLQVT